MYLTEGHLRQPQWRHFLGRARAELSPDTRERLREKDREYRKRKKAEVEQSKLAGGGASGGAASVTLRT